LLNVLLKINRDQGRLGQIKSTLRQLMANLNDSKDHRQSRIHFDVDPF
jgi:hypothetical protein